MNRTTLIVAAAVAALAGSLLAQSQTPSSPDAPAEPPERPIDGLPLSQQMVMIQGTATRVATDATADEPAALAGLDELQRRVIAAKRQPPPRFGNLDAAAQRRHDRAFRKALAELLIETARIEIALLDGAAGQVTAGLDRIEAMREEGHAAFQAPRTKRERPRADLADAVVLTAAQRRAYTGVFEFADVGVRISVIERDGHLYLETFGQPAERLYTQGDHAFRIAVSAEALITFDIDDDTGVARAIVLDAGGGRPKQRIERVR